MNELLIAAISGLSIGFMGSVHCIGMCGPIALALPVHQMSRGTGLLSAGLYNLGRAMMYALFGLLFGFIGSRFHVWGFQQFLSISAGILILLFVFLHFKVSIQHPWLAKGKNLLHQKLSRLLNGPKKPLTFFAIGGLNGLLPCGLVYVALAAALATGDIISGFLLMFSFGIGTWPVMAGMMLLGNRVPVPLRRKLNRAVPYAVSIMAILLILRGMNLGISYISPKHTSGSIEAPMCHQPESETVKQ